VWVFTIDNDGVSKSDESENSSTSGSGR